MSTIQRSANDHLIIGHGDYREKDHYPQFNLDRDITIHLVAVPGALVRIRLGQALVGRIKCQLHLKKSNTNEIIDPNYAIKSYRKNDQMPNYLLTYAQEINTGVDATVHTPGRGAAVRLQQLIADLPPNAKVAYVACCAIMAENEKQQLYSVDYS